MAIDPTAGQVATAQLSSIPFGDLIGAPLNAAIEAQGKAAMSTYEFIQAVGVQINPTTKMAEAVTVAFSFQSATGETRNLIVPLLSIVPIPLLIIDDLNISFKANISAESSTEESTLDSASLSAEAAASLEYWCAKANFTASYSSKKDSTATANSRYSVEYTMDVNVHASQASMPAGLATMLQLLSSSVTSVNPSGFLNVSPSGTVLRVSSPVTVSIQVVDGLNRPVANITPTMSSSIATVRVMGTPAPTDSNGNTTMRLMYHALTLASATITIWANGSGVSASSQFTLQVGPAE